MARAKDAGGGEPKTTPQSFPSTTPPAGAPDRSDWLLTAVNKNTEALGELKGTVAGLQLQITGLEKSVEKATDATSKHGKWIAVASAMVGLAAIAFGWLANVLSDVLKELIKAKIGP